MASSRTLEAIVRNLQVQLERVLVLDAALSSLELRVQRLENWLNTHATGFAQLEARFTQIEDSIRSIERVVHDICLHIACRAQHLP